jgi:multidrug resistance efflux pump
MNNQSCEVSMGFFRTSKENLILLVTLALVLVGCGGTQSIPTLTISTPQAGTSAPKSRTLAEANVIPIQNATMSFSIPGIIEVVYAREGDQVQSGQVIARLKGTSRVMAAIAQTDVMVVQAQKDLNDFQEKSKLATTAAELKLAQAQITLKTVLDRRESLDFQQVTQNTIDTLRANYYLAQDAFTTASDDYDQVKNRSDTDLVKAAALSKLSAARQTRDNALFRLNKALEKPDSNKIAEADANVAVAKAAVDDAQISLDKVKNGPDSTQVKLLEANLANAQAQAVAAKASLSDLELKAPFSGMIVSSELEVGESGGPTTAVLLGDLSSWRIETTDLTELDIPAVRENDPVTVSFDAIPDLKLPGVVARIKQLGENKQGDITYKVYINLTQQDPRLLWNMRAFVAFKATQ